jgi:hypothetical protein
LAGGAAGEILLGGDVRGKAPITSARAAQKEEMNAY